MKKNANNANVNPGQLPAASHAPLTIEVPRFMPAFLAGLITILDTTGSIVEEDLERLLGELNDSAAVSYQKLVRLHSQESWELFNIGLPWNLYERLEDAAVALNLPGPDFIMAELLRSFLVDGGGSNLGECFFEGWKWEPAELADCREVFGKLLEKWAAEDAEGGPALVPIEGPVADRNERSVAVEIQLRPDVWEQFQREARQTGLPASTCVAIAIGALQESRSKGEFVKMEVEVKPDHHRTLAEYAQRVGQPISRVGGVCIEGKLEDFMKEDGE